MIAMDTAARLRFDGDPGAAAKMAAAVYDRLPATYRSSLRTPAPSSSTDTWTALRASCSATRSPESVGHQAGSPLAAPTCTDITGALPPSVEYPFQAVGWGHALAPTTCVSGD